MDLSLSSGRDSSSAFVEEIPGSLSSSFDSEAEFSDRSVNADDEVLSEGIRLKEDFPDLEQDGQENTDNILSERKNRSYGELLRKFIKSEEELKVSNLKLQLSEEEVIKLKNQIKEREGHLDNVRKELKMKEDDHEYEKGQVLELQKQTTDLETHVPDCSQQIPMLKIQIEEGQLDNVRKELKIKEVDLEYEKGQVLELQKLVEQLEAAREQLKVSNDEKTRLKEELKNRCSLNHELQGQHKGALETAEKSEAAMKWLLESGAENTEVLNDKITQYQANEAKHVLERKKLKAEKEQLHSDVKSKSKVQKQMESRLREGEDRSKLFESKSKQSEDEKLELEELNASQQMVLQGQISSLKEELDQGRHDVETVNKEFDEHKQKYSMLMTEKDGANAKIDKLVAEVSSGDNQIANMKRELLQVQAQQAELISGFEAKLNLVNELKLKVEELENEVTRQNAVISDRAEEKREAIRQLCISLEHCRNEYQQLHFAFLEQ
ncbi:hypothetical protein TanjilG_09575 [Lupinus angustifolius]|uniref:Uncharacterized protein n=1 Tax=Lupinus angustifolius TaxID=3871 RepID=A0A1J7HC98_LUPAN|nr:hypothetical protein TanjilG_09575 [Lupinus angustifolius]